ncbi:Nif3-like dinuclear metal center hexameric protein [Candidatus Woesearchaeota archaeon CG_4_10_14_0_2_um_filter_33_13]|nr:MAG: Nif3-like dinuclear metal center hexameric protein [Candidatus Woesearchaeota archaeon CG_4_10_14_0_2_um_filter_33_13]
MATAKEITEFLNKEIEINSIEDKSCNGLQVENTGDVKKIGFTVDACLETFQKSALAGCQMLIVHHGLIWEGIKYIKGNTYKRIKCLIDNNLALYAAHLPLDRHDKYGNNIILANLLNLKDIKSFGFYGDKTIGFYGQTEVELEQIKEKLKEAGMNLTCFEYGPRQIKKVTIVSGAFTDGAYQAVSLSADLYLTGENKYNYLQVAKENNLNIICAGHYLTETLGVKALMPLLKEKFGVEVEFIENPVGL